MGQIIWNSQSPQHVARLDARRRARGTGAYSEGLQSHQECFAVDVGNADVEIARKTIRGGIIKRRAIDDEVGKTLFKAAEEAVAQVADSGGFGRHLRGGQCTGKAKADDIRDSKRTGPKA